MRIPPLGTKYKTTEIPKFLNELATKKYIQLTKYKSSSCSGRESVYIEERLTPCKYTFSFSVRKQEDYVVCPNCGNEYEYEEISLHAEIISEVTSINYQLIINDIIQAIQVQECEVVELKGYKNNYILKCPNTHYEYLVVFSGADSDKRAMLNALETKSGIIYIEITEEKTTLPDTAISVSASELLSEGLKNLYQHLKVLPASNEIISRLKIISEVEDEIIRLSSSVTWQVVENEITNFFLDKIRSSVVAKYKYKVMLELLPQFSLIPVNAAGAGNADKFTINMLDYLEEIFEDNFTADAKCYTSTSVDHKTMEKVLHHLSKTPLDAKRVVIVATTNNVTCWDTVFNYKSVTGKYRLIIFTAKLIAEVSVQLGFYREFLDIFRKSTQ